VNGSLVFSMIIANLCACGDMFRLARLFTPKYSLTTTNVVKIVKNFLAIWCKQKL